MNLFKDIREYRAKYEELGFDTLPLRAGTKKPLRDDWPSREPSQMWENAPEDANIGIRMGGELNLAVIDCDDKIQPGTANNVQKYLAGLGLQPGDYPVVQTASGVGRHYYFTFSGGLEGCSRNLAPDIGTGDFRYGQGKQVAAPPSIITGGSKYEHIDGDFRQLHCLTLTDLSPILSINEPKLDRSTQEIPSILAVTESRLGGSIRRISRLGLALLQGKMVSKYPCKSRAEEALISTMINAGYDFPSVLDMYNKYPCAGKLRILKEEKGVEEAERWLKISYDNAYQYLSTHESEPRQAALLVLEWAESFAWPGRTGGVDGDIFIAHALLWYRAGCPTYAASFRDIGDKAGVEPMTARRATLRHCSTGYISIVNPGHGEDANEYRINVIPGHTYTLPHSAGVGKCITMSHDCFRIRGLGKSAKLVYSTLQDRPSTIDELKKSTGRSKKTIRRVLKRMASLVDTTTGEVVSMVELEGNCWRALDVDLDQVARIVHTSGVGKAKREKHAEERRRYHRAVNPGSSSEEIGHDILPLPSND
jgi:hypothetical protein